MKKTHMTFLLVFSVVIISALLRFYKLADFSFWYDEVFSIQTIFSGNLSRLPYPLFYFITDGMFQWLGVSEFTARLIPCLFGILSVYLTYLCTKLIFDRRTGIIAAALVSIHTWHIFFSQSARFYIFLYPLVLVSFTAFVYAVKKNSRKHLILAVLFALICPLFHTTGILLFLIYFVFFSILIFQKTKPDFANWKNILISFSPLLLFLFFLPRILSAVGRYLESGPGQIFPLNFGNFLFILKGIVFFIGIPVFLFGMVSPVLLWIKDKHKGMLFSLYIGVPLVLFSVLGLVFRTHARHLFISLPAYFLVTAFALNQLLEHKKTVLVGSLVILVIFAVYLSDDFLYFDRYNGHRAQWKEACQSIKPCLKDGDIIMTHLPIMPQFYLSEREKPFEKYEKDVDFSFFDFNYGETDRIEALGKRVWFIVDYTGIHKFGEFDKGVLNWIKKNSEPIAEFITYTGPRNRSLSVFLFTPEKERD